MSTAFQRASVSKIALEEARKLPGSARVLANVDPEVIASIEGASRTAWVPFTDVLQIYKAVHRGAGDAGVFRLGRAMSVRSSDVPLFVPVVRTVMNILGGGPLAVIQKLPSAIDFATKGIGVCNVREDDDALGAVLTFRAIPHAIRDHVYGVSWVGLVRGAFDIVGGPVRVTGYGSSLPDGQIRLALRWSNEEKNRPSSFEA